MQLHLVLLGRLRHIVEDVVEGNRVVRRQQLLLDLLAGLLQVVTLLRYLLHAVVAQLEATHWCAADILSIGLFLDHEGEVVEDGTRDQPLNDEVLVCHALIIRNGKLDNARLDHDEAIDQGPLLENGVTLCIRPSLHVVQQLLLRDHVKIPEVLDLVTLDLEEGAQVILVLKNVLFEARRQRRELIVELLKSFLGETRQ